MRFQIGYWPKPSGIGDDSCGPDRTPFGNAERIHSCPRDLCSLSEGASLAKSERGGSHRGISASLYGDRTEGGGAGPEESGYCLGDVIREKKVSMLTETTRANLVTNAEQFPLTSFRTLRTAPP